MDLDTQVWVFVGVPTAIILIFLLYLMYKKIQLDRKGRIRANFIYDDRTIERKSYYGIVDKLIFDELEYDYNDNLTIKIRGVKHIFYYIGNKNPIDIHNPKDNKMTYADFKKILKSKVINDLLEDEQPTLTPFEKKALILLVVIGLLVVAVNWYYSQQPQVIQLPPNFNELIQNATRSALRG